jgi:hypothetical protein
LNCIFVRIFHFENHCPLSYPCKPAKKLYSTYNPFILEQAPRAEFVGLILATDSCESPHSAESCGFSLGTLEVLLSSYSYMYQSFLR